MNRIDELIEKAEAGTLTQADADRACLLLELDAAKRATDLLDEMIEDERNANERFEQFASELVGE